MTSTDATLLDLDGAESIRVWADGVDLHVVAAGPEDGPLVVLLHGFPEFWYAWREQIRPLAEAGYRVFVPDQRGYNLSDKPADTAAYRLPGLSGDVACLVAAEGRERAHVVGHDWGAAVAWDLALRRPDVVDRLGIVNVPHPRAYLRTLRSNPRQVLRSWYVLFFQVPRLPEWLLGRRDFRALVRGLRKTSHEGAFSEADLERYRSAWRRDGGLRAPLDWYRAAARYRDSPPRERVGRPTLIVWGDRDEALVPELADRSLEYCEEGRVERFPDATHWVHHEEPRRVSDLLLDHLDG